MKVEVFPIVLALVVAFAITSVSGVWVVPFLKRLKFGQEINDVGPTWHKKKQGTPTMGGIMFIIGSIAGILFGYIALLGRMGSFDNLTKAESSRMFSGIVFALALAMVGFVDDYIKIVRKTNDGLTERQKTIAQFVAIFSYMLVLWIGGNHSTAFWIPFIGLQDMGIFYYPFSVVIIYATINAVNFTDGIDGLCTSVTTIVGIGFLCISIFLQENIAGIFSAVLVGGCMGFFIWNRYPAKVFMGDTGSLFLGGMVVALAFGLNRPFLIPLLGIVYVWEIATVFIQRVYYKLTKKRLFKMTPIHHSFELSGYSENKIVFLFSLITLAGTALGVASVYFS